MAPKILGLSLLFVLLASNAILTIAQNTTISGTATSSGTTAISPTSSGGSSTGSVSPTQGTSGSSGTPGATSSGSGTSAPTANPTSSGSPSPSQSPSSTGGPTATPTSSGSSSPSQSPSSTGGPTATPTSSGGSSPSQSPPTTGSTGMPVSVVTVSTTVTTTRYSTITADRGTPSPFPPALPLGCYNEGPHGRALPEFFYEDEVLMTIDKCVHLCANYTFLGLEYGSQCWCGNSIQHDAFPVDDRQCSMVCAGNAQQICGGENTLSVYLPPPPPPPRPINRITYSAAGCYAEPADGSRALTKSRTSTHAMTPAACFNICGTSGRVYAGLEYGRECWCGNHLSNAATMVDPSRCNMKCSGDATQMCGGERLFNLYNGTRNLSSVASLTPGHARIWDRLLDGDV
ncbi:hypothetical protein diail_11641 [Diaporthe ilicicola]|nr:hypothetical protein diail_11641 [Diaporthe ilicicola]